MTHHKSTRVEIPLTQDPPPDYNIGDRVMYRGLEDNIWSINSIDQGVNCWWVRASQNSVTQCFPAGSFVKVQKIETPTVKPVERPKIKVEKTEKPKVPDEIARLMSEAEDIEHCWDIAKLAGLDVDDLKTKIGNLSNGLQRMNIGNILRRMWKSGEFDPIRVQWKKDKFVMTPIAKR